MQRRHLIAGGLAAAALPTFALAQAIDKPKLTIAVGGKNLFYYLRNLAVGQVYAGRSVGIYKYTTGLRHADSIGNLNQHFVSNAGCN